MALALVEKSYGRRAYLWHSSVPLVVSSCAAHLHPPALHMCTATDFASRVLHRCTAGGMAPMILPMDVVMGMGMGGPMGGGRGGGGGRG